MREIKFRFWYAPGMGNPHMVYYPKDEINIDNYLRTNNTVMQYTGLKDSKWGSN